MLLQNIWNRENLKCNIARSFPFTLVGSANSPKEKNSPQDQKILYYFFVMLQETGHAQDNWPPEMVDRDSEQNTNPVIQEDTISDMLSHLDALMSMGPVGIHPRMMSKLAEELTKPLSITYHHSWLTGEVPDDWKLANITHP